MDGLCELGGDSTPVRVEVSGPVKIALGSKSAIKERAVRKALEIMASEFPGGFELVTAEVGSCVPKQPRGYDEIYAGAFHRATEALRVTDAHIGIGIENGLVGRHLGGVGYRWFDPPGVAAVTSSGREGYCPGLHLPIPGYMVNKVHKDNSELGVVVQEFAGGGEKDPHKYLSKGFLDREMIITQAVIAALGQALHADLYK